MRNFAGLLVLVFLLTPGRLAAQQPPAQTARVAPSVGVFGGLGSGPIDAASWGISVGYPVWRYLSIRAEYSGWGNGLGDTACVATPPESHRCSVSGWAGLAGVRAVIPLTVRLDAYGEIAGGRFFRDWLGDQTVASAALSAEVGARVHVLGNLSALVGGRFLRTSDDDYRALLGERLKYAVGTIGLEYRFPR